MEEAKKEKKVFDSTVCFSFFSDWLVAIEGAETEADRNSAAYMLFKNIANYSLYDIEPDFENNAASRVYENFWPMITNEIRASIKQRQHGYIVLNRPDDEQQKVIDEFISNPSAGVREIARKTGVDKSKVSRTLKKYGSCITTAIASASSNANANADADANANANANANAGTSSETVETDVRQNETVIQDSIECNVNSSGDDTSPEEKAAIYERLNEVCRNQFDYTNRSSDVVLQWKERYHRRYRQITNGGAFPKVAFIMERYLADHEETPIEKKYGEKYGRYIIGWDDEKMEPLVAYTFSYLPNSMMKHKIDMVPNWYIVHDERRRQELKEQWMIERGLLVPDNEQEGELPF